MYDLSSHPQHLRQNYNYFAAEFILYLRDHLIQTGSAAT